MRNCSRMLLPWPGWPNILPASSAPCSHGLPRRTHCARPRRAKGYPGLSNARSRRSSSVHSMSRTWPDLASKHDYLGEQARMAPEPASGPPGGVRGRGNVARPRRGHHPCRRRGAGAVKNGSSNAAMLRRSPLAMRRWKSDEQRKEKLGPANTGPSFFVPLA
jgi:hypothetical protein